MRAVIPAIILITTFCLQNATAQPFFLPTANKALLNPGDESQFFIGTPGHPWSHGCFGCVRSLGNQMHEGIDIRCLNRDKNGESIDVVRAIAAGTVVYINNKTYLSNYGKYIILEHKIQGITIYSLYAHLREIKLGLAADTQVIAGEPIAIMGRSSNTRSGISKSRAHLHLEIGFILNTAFWKWFEQRYPDGINDHGSWNGLNFCGIDPAALFLEQKAAGAEFSLKNFLINRHELCRIRVDTVDFDWPKQHPELITQNPETPESETAGYELVLDFNGFPFKLIPLTKDEVSGVSGFDLISVNEAEEEKNPCRNLVKHTSAGWKLTTKGHRLMDILTFK
ncbi:MAG: M23 family metallopeptidase [Verrucomicrobia bacterium]|nr:M23 family metallopeptidase [Verrucomicrobiota bacterium]